MKRQICTPIAFVPAIPDWNAFLSLVLVCLDLMMGYVLDPVCGGIILLGCWFLLFRFGLEQYSVCYRAW